MQTSLSPVFREAMLSTASGFASTVTSGPIRMSGNKAVLGAIVKNISASSTFTLYLDGSYEGQMWKQLTSVAQSAFGWNSVAQTGVDYAFVRIRAVLTGTDVTVLFDATLDLSSQ